MACFKCRQGQAKVKVGLVRLLSNALEAFVAFMEFKQRIYIDELEDKIDDLARDGSPAAKLRIDRLGKRLKRERIRFIRSSNDPSS